MKPDIKEARKFIKMLTGDAKAVMDFRAVSDREDKGAGSKPVKFRGTVDDFFNAGLIRPDHGVFVMINETDGKGARKENVRKVRALFIDIDGAPLPKTFHKKPSAVVQRDETHFHVYWKVNDVSPAEFKSMQEGLISQYGSDEKIKDLPRIMRLPGTLHVKGAPILVKMTKSENVVYSKKDFPFAKAVKETAEKPSEKNTTYENTTPRFDAYFRVLNEWPVVHDGEGREKAVFVAACRGKDFAVPPDIRLPLLLKFNQEKISPPLPESVVKLKNKNAETYGEKSIGESTIEREFEEIDTPDPDDLYSNIKKALRGWVYIIPLGVMRNIETGFEIPGREVNVAFNRYMPKKENGSLYVKAMNYIENASPIPLCERMVYEPGRPKLITSRHKGFHDFNIYAETGIKPAKGEMGWYHDLMQYLFPDSREREYVEDFFSHIVQQPTRPANFALLIHSHKKGIGKSYLGHLLSRIVGRDEEQLSVANARTVSNDDISGTSTRWIEGKRLIIVEEVMQPGRIDLINRLKPFITERIISVRRLYSDSYPMKNYANFLMFSNFANALKIEDTERRFLIISSPAEPQSTEYWSDLWDDVDAKASSLAFYLLNRKIKYLDPMGRAPDTKAKALMQDLNRSDLESLLHDRFDSESWPFNFAVLKPDLILENSAFEKFQYVSHAMSTVRNFLNEKGFRRSDRRINHKADIHGVTRSYPWTKENFKHKDSDEKTSEEMNRFLSSFSMPEITEETNS